MSQFTKTLDECLSFLVNYTIKNMEFVLEEEKGSGKLKITMFLNRGMIAKRAGDTEHQHNVAVDVTKKILDSKFNINDSTVINMNIGAVKNEESWETRSVITLKIDMLNALKSWWDKHRDAFKNIYVDTIMADEESQQQTPQSKDKVKTKREIDPMVIAIKDFMQRMSLDKVNSLIRTWNTYRHNNRNDPNFMEKFITTNIDSNDQEMFRRKLNETMRNLNRNKDRIGV